MSFSLILKRIWCRLTGYDVFISYAQRDGLNYAKGLQRQLESGKRKLLVFRDETGLEGSGELRPELLREVRRCRVLAVVVSPGACESKWVADEVAVRIDNGRRKRFGLFQRPAAVVPLLLPPVNTKALPEPLGVLSGYLWAEETPQALATGQVSTRTL